ncbi:protein of unknown function [Taphrina deformans PYCC 5710]|uniref:Sec20 C-terminal domain-containing protein n=1 Tax=Taphrina deformans (strain PYCC 5710 / ATCC 11124 / CBS 356.35 / IMI 108563 / JCM 9778 / NBRC 8474) TaxID=1097556 RepID=R4XD85_TAPDE|nr:protein of unknown function [Taphrina deformans PYCC 5710]|eukprot:CCG83790.1 protein of unknown function [Taphrina deformans PYCC 5710]
MEDRLVEVGSLSREIFSLTARLANSPGPASLHVDLVAALRESIQQLDRDLTYAETFVEDEDVLATRNAQRLTIRRFREDYKTHRALYRRAVVRSKDNLQRATLDQAKENTVTAVAAAASTTDQTESDHDQRRKKNKFQSASNSVIQASSDVTLELRKTHALMSEELSRSALSQELLEESSSTLSRLGNEYYNFGTILNGSKRLLKELENANKVDQMWIWGSFGFFCLVVTYVLYRRILSRPVNALVWTGSFVFSRVSRRKIIEDRARPSFPISASPSSVTNQGVLYDKGTDKSDQHAQTDVDEVIDLVVPDLVQDEDEAARISRGRVNAPPIIETEETDIVHVEL